MSNLKVVFQVNDQLTDELSSAKLSLKFGLQFQRKGQNWPTIFSWQLETRIRIGHLLKESNSHVHWLKSLAKTNPTCETSDLNLTFGYQH